MAMKRLLVLLVLALSSGFAKEPLKFSLAGDDITYVVLDAEPAKPWICSISLSDEKLKELKAFTAAHAGEEFSLIVDGKEVYRPTFGEAVKGNPITFRMYAKDKFLAILEALPDDP